MNVRRSSPQLRSSFFRPPLFVASPPLHTHTHFLFFFDDNPRPPFALKGGEATMIILFSAQPQPPAGVQFTHE